jgi:hypothetical protein
MRLESKEKEKEIEEECREMLEGKETEKRRGNEGGRKSYGEE